MRHVVSVPLSIAAGLACLLPVFALAQAPPAPPRGQKPADQKPADQKPAEQKPAEAKPAEQKPPVKFVTSKDGTRIAYEMTGSGPAVMLLHGAGQTRQDWQRIGYVKRLAPQFTVISVDLRGNGDSDKPIGSEKYGIDRLLEDLLAVADDAKAARFHLWGYAYGGLVGRSLAARSDRVQSFVYIGVPFGAPVSGVMKDAITGFRARWLPVLQDEQAGKLDLKKLAPGDAEAWPRVRMLLSWQSALAEYPPVEPSEIRCPSLWVVGMSDAEAMTGVKAYEGKLAGTKVTLLTVDSLYHSATLESIDLVFQKELDFTLKAGG